MPPDAPIPLLALSTYSSCPIHPYTPVNPIMAPQISTPPSFQLLSCSIVVTLQLTIFIQLKHSFSIVIIFNCHHFATDHLHAVKMLIFYCHHFHLLLLSVSNWPFSFSIVITLQLTIFRSMSSLQYTICRCQGYIFIAVKLSQFLQYLPKYAL